MCGIFGVFGKTIDKKQAEEGFARIVHRGKDNVGTDSTKNRYLSHCLHAIVGHVKQPFITHNSAFMTNCEIYNWKELAKKYSIHAKNDAELFFLLLERKGISALDELDGVYAFYYQKDDTVWLGRDLLGEKPLCFTHEKNVFAFASEAKALSHFGSVQHLHPVTLLEYNNKTGYKKIIQRTFFSLPSETKQKKEEIISCLQEKLTKAVRKRINGLSHVGILFSGGIDSTLVAYLCKKMNIPFTCYTAAFADGNTRAAPDLLEAQKVAKQLGFSLKTIIVDSKETEKAVREVIKIIETTDVVKVGVALPFYFVAKEAARDGHKVMLSGLGSEELFAGYQRHLDALKNNEDVNEECLNGLKKIWERDLYRDDCIMMSQTLELRLPFLDYDLIKYALSIPSEYKIDETQNKKILREMAIQLRIPETFAFRKKVAAQYGSNFDKALEKLAKKAGCKSKKEYLVELSLLKKD